MEGIDKVRELLLGLDVYSGPKRCPSFGSHWKETQEISEVCVGGNHIQVHLSTVWSVQYTKNIHKKLVMAYLHFQGLQTVIYLDDILILAENRDILLHHMHYTVQLLE